MPVNSSGQALTEDLFLGGRVRILQPAAGFRSGIEPVLLAAAIPARPGERVLEGGSGTGAGLLCLAARVGRLVGLGIERDAALAALAQRNAEANGWTDLSFRVSDLCEATDLGHFDHAFANPPYHAAGGTNSPHPAREAAKRAHAGLLVAWVSALAGAVRYHGTVTFILPTGAIPEVLAAMHRSRCQARSLVPLWSRPDRPAKLALVQGVKDGRSPLMLLPGLTLHTADGAFTEAAEDVLRRAQGLAMS